MKSKGFAIFFFFGGGGGGAAGIMADVQVANCKTRGTFFARFLETFFKFFL